MLHISSTLLLLCKDLGLEEKMFLQQMQEVWHEILSEPLNLHTCPCDLKNGELLINVDSPVWLQQLKFLQPMIIQKLGCYPVKSVRLRLGRVKIKSLVKRVDSGLKSPKKPSRAIAASDVEWVNRLLSDITDTEMKECIRKAMQNSLRYSYKSKKDKKKKQ